MYSVLMFTTKSDCVKRSGPQLIGCRHWIYLLEAAPNLVPYDVGTGIVHHGTGGILPVTSQIPDIFSKFSVLCLAYIDKIITVTFLLYTKLNIFSVNKVLTIVLPSVGGDRQCMRTNAIRVFTE